MKFSMVLPLIALSALTLAQNQRSDSAAMKIAKGAADSVTSALHMGKTVSISVDNRLTDYTARLIGGRLLVPARLFNETGQRVLWTGADKRGIIRDDHDPRRTVEMDAREPKDGRTVVAMRPILENGRLWVPLVSTVNSFGHTLSWAGESSRLNISTNRAAGR
jgi:hypothetical protein